MEKYDSREDTLKHIENVQEKINFFIDLLKERANIHDASKLLDPEKETFDIVTPRLRGMTFGSEEYNQSLKEMSTALSHHYQNNSHHPEHYENGIDGMDLVDLVEMFMDWCAATERHANGDLYKSIEINQKKHNISDQLTNIFKNTFNRYINKK